MTENFMITCSKSKIICTARQLQSAVLQSMVNVTKILVMMFESKAILSRSWWKIKAQNMSFFSNNFLMNSSLFCKTLRPNSIYLFQNYSVSGKYIVKVSKLWNKFKIHLWQYLSLVGELVIETVLPSQTGLNNICE